MIQYVQEVVTHFILLLYKMGHYFLDTQYYTYHYTLVRYKKNLHITLA